MSRGVPPRVDPGYSSAAFGANSVPHLFMDPLLKAFAGISLTIIQNAAGEDILRRLTPLSGVQEDILQRLGLGTALYEQLEIQTMGT